MVSGVLVVDKPAGPTSFDVVRRVRGLLKGERVGHTGTLDPLATGVLPLCVGEATRLAGYILEGDKTYLAAVKLGETTDTQDAAGRTLQTRPVPPLGREDVEHALEGFRGTIQQTPPMYSALKVNGRRLYDLAREGQEVERAPREVHIYELALVEAEPDVLHLRVHCSKGTYIRSLAADLGEVLGTGAHIKALRRIRSGPFLDAQAADLKTLMDREKELGPRGVAQLLLPIETAFESSERFDVDVEQVRRWVRNGVPIPLDQPRAEGQQIRIHGPNGRMIALARVAGRQLTYLRVLPLSVEDSVAGA
jgi:tRNA pseudouridine55 synthase